MIFDKVHTTSCPGCKDGEIAYGILNVGTGYTALHLNDLSYHEPMCTRTDEDIEKVLDQVCEDFLFDG